MAGTADTTRSARAAELPPPRAVSVLAPLGVFALACAATLAIGLRWLDGDSAAAAPAIGLIALGAGIVVLLSATLRRAPERIGWALAAVWGLIWAFAVCNAVAGRVELVGYGDAGFLAGRLETEGGLFPRWLAANAVLEWLYVGLWRSPFLAGVVPEGRPGTELFISLAGATVMAACAAGASLAWARRAPLAVALAVLAPITVMLGLGYDEIYPFVAGPFLVFLLWLLSRRVDRVDGVRVGVWLGILAVLYVPFAAFSAVVATTLAGLRRDLLPRVAGAAAATVVAGITVCWPHGVSHFFRALHMTLNLGETNTLFARYAGHAASPRSLFFQWEYALSSEHLADVLSTWWWSGTLAMVGASALAAGAAVVLVGRREAGSLLEELRGDGRIWLALAIAAQQLHWALFMLPKLGPRQDLDLFFSAYLVAAVLAGGALDRVARSATDPARVVVAVAAAAVGASVAGLAVLVLAGVPAAG